MGGTANAGVTFEGDSWLLGRVFVPRKSAVRHASLVEVGRMILRGGEGLRIGVHIHALMLFWSGHGRRVVQTG